MTSSPVDGHLLELVSGPAPGSLAEVVLRMRALDRALPQEDGLKWFNWLYLTVTERIGGETAARRWQDGPWLERLDVIFAGLYFEAIRLWLTEPARCPRAWAPLLDRRQHPGIDRLQFALAGMNAHINRDLAVALVRLCELDGAGPDRTGPHHADYLQVNDALDAVETAAVTALATGLIGALARLGRTDDLLAMWQVREARNAAWTHAEMLWQLRELPTLAARYLASMDRMAGYAGRGLLLARPLAG
jgi:hypothetical protein